MLRKQSLDQCVVLLLFVPRGTIKCTIGPLIRKPEIVRGSCEGWVPAGPPSAQIALHRSPADTPRPGHQTQTSWDIQANPSHHGQAVRKTWMRLTAGGLQRVQAGEWSGTRSRWESWPTPVRWWPPQASYRDQGLTLLWRQNFCFPSELIKVGSSDSPSQSSQ